MSDNEDDFMCDDEEDYGLVSQLFEAILEPNLTFLDIFGYKYHFSVNMLLLWTFFIQEYSEDSNSEPDVDLENQYYNSKALKEDEPAAALVSFQKVLDLESGEKGEWGFKALKQMIKINFKLVRCLTLYYIL